MVRILVVGGFLLVSVVITAWAFWVGVNTPLGTTLVNLGTEIFGILITLAVVDWLLERRRLQDRARELAWRILHGIERVVWLWQGGPRRLETDELLGLISGISPSHALQPFTRAQLVTLGTQGRESLNRERAAIRTLPGLEDALAELSSLHTLSDGGDSAGSLRMVTEVLDSATRGLARVLGQPTQRMPGGLVRQRDPSLQAQEERFYDMTADSGMARTGPRPGPSPSSSSSE